MAIIEEPLTQAIERLRAQHNDDADYEAKSCATDLDKSVWESVSAFANTDGGTLGRSLQTVRRLLRELVDDGTITAIGKKQSRSRAYTRGRTTE